MSELILHLPGIVVGALNDNGDSLKEFAGTCEVKRVGRGYRHSAPSSTEEASAFLTEGFTIGKAMTDSDDLTIRAEGRKIINGVVSAVEGIKAQGFTARMDATLGTVSVTAKP